MNRRIIRAIKAFAMAAAAVCIVTGVVYAAAWGPNTNFSGSNVGFWGRTSNELFIDPYGNGSESDRGYVYVAPTAASMGTSDHMDTWGRALVAVVRAGTGANDDDATAWMQSSANAKVEVLPDGDVVITLGN